MAAQTLDGAQSDRAAGETGWARIRASKIEDLSDAVHGAGLSAIQMSRGLLNSSLAFAEHDGVTYNTGLIGGTVSLSGTLSEDALTLGLALQMPPGSRQWLREVTAGDFAVFLQGSGHDALYMPDSLYVTATLSLDRIEQIAAEMGVILEAQHFSQSGVSSRPLPQEPLRYLQTRIRQVHAIHPAKSPAISPGIGRIFLEAAIGQLSRLPRPQLAGSDSTGLARIITQARDFIHANLDRPLSVNAIAVAARTSQRTLHRAFQLVLDETPYSYVRRVRLHRIREDLNATGCKENITAVANRWGIFELGRLSGHYRDLFGELPSATLLGKLVR